MWKKIALWTGVVGVGLVLLALRARVLKPPPLTAQDHWPPGNYERTLEFDGQTRTFVLHIPTGYDGAEPFPLVVGLHGGVGTGKQFERSAEMNAKADEWGFIAVYPDGTGLLQTWNAGHCCGAALRREVDDVGFMRALVEALQETLAIDSQRIYATGMSNGAILSFHLGAELSDVFAAIGPVAGTIGGRAEEDASLVVIPPPAEPVSVIMFHGREDRSVLYEGGRSEGVDAGRTDLSVAESIAFWVEHNQCSTVPDTEVTHEGNIIRERYACQPEGVEVVLYTIVDGGHAWPGGPKPALRSADPPTQDISATDLMLEFFLAHPKPEPEG